MICHLVIVNNDFRFGALFTSNFIMKPSYHEQSHSNFFRSDWPFDSVLCLEFFVLSHLHAFHFLAHTTHFFYHVLSSREAVVNDDVHHVLSDIVSHV